MTLPVKSLSEIEVKSEVSENDKILILDSVSDEARLASKDEIKGENGEDGNGITSVTSSKVGRTTTVTMNFDEGDPFSFEVQDGINGEGAGDVIGPDSSTDGHLAVFDGTTGKKIKDGGAMPTIPTKVSQLDNDSGFTTNTGTITSVKMNGTTVASSGEADLGTINETKVSATAPSSPTEGMLWYDTTNDVLKTYDGTNWNEVGGGGGGEGNTKTFTLSGTSGATALSEAQAIYDRYNAGKNPIVMYDGKLYLFSQKQSSMILFSNEDIGTSHYSNLGYSNTKQTKVVFMLSSDTVTSISASSYANAGVSVLATNQNYSTPYTPQYNGSPATKKYVDDGLSGSVKYEDFETSTTVGATLTISYFTTQITPSANFTLVAGTVKEGMQYIVRVNTGATVYTMSLGTGVTNPFGEDLTLTASKTTTVVLLATSSSTLEIFSIRTAE